MRSMMQYREDGMVETTVPQVPEDADIELAERVNLLRRRFEMQEAEAIARDGLRRFPDSVDILIAFGRVLLVTHRREDAVRFFRKLAPRSTMTA
jgi:hypothetical protein